MATLIDKGVTQWDGSVWDLNAPWGGYWMRGGFFWCSTGESVFQCTVDVRGSGRDREGVDQSSGRWR